MPVKDDEMPLAAPVESVEPAVLSRGQVAAVYRGPSDMLIVEHQNFPAHEIVHAPQVLVEQAQAMGHQIDILED